MRFFYIDTENRTADQWVSRLRNLKSTDVVYMVYTGNSAKVPVQLLVCVRECAAKLIPIDAVPGTPNALDFVLTTVMAQKVVTASKSAHVVISADKGYDAAITYLKRLKIYALRAPNLTEALRILNGTKY